MKKKIARLIGVSIFLKYEIGRLLVSAAIISLFLVSSIKHVRAEDSQINPCDEECVSLVKDIAQKRQEKIKERNSQIILIPKTFKYMKPSRLPTYKNYKGNTKIDQT